MTWQRVWCGARLGCARMPGSRSGDVGLVSAPEFFWGNVPDTALWSRTAYLGVSYRYESSSPASIRDRLTTLTFVSGLTGPFQLVLIIFPLSMPLGIPPLGPTPHSVLKSKDRRQRAIC
jgi:hypothetical protein